MRTLLFVGLFCISSVFGDLSTVSSSSTTWQDFDQILDHFDKNGKPEFWKQRVNVDTTSYKIGGPMFIFLGGEAPVEFFQFQEIEPETLAKEMGAGYVRIEHRFYGKSLPRANYSSENLVYLSSQQALADAAYFIQEYEKTISPEQPTGPWVVWGCSYSGALSAWFRLKYPQIVLASVAPSGPVLAELNFTQYYNQFYTSAPKTCVNAAETATASITAALKTEDGRKKLSDTFNSCEPLTPAHAFYFKLQITSVLGSSDQYDNPPAWPLTAACKTLTKGDPVSGWAELVEQSNQAQMPATLRNAHPLRLGQREDGSQCVDFNEANWIKAMQDETSQDRSWWWQKCTEFGFFQTSYGDSSPFFDDITLEQQVKYCGEIYGIGGMTPNVGWTNTFYGGKDLHATNVMFANGLIDPWHRLSVTANNSYGVSAVTFECGHCGNMIKPTTEDPATLTAARQEIKDFLVGLLK